MAGERRPVTIHYRKFERTGINSSATFENLIRNALSSISNGVPIKDRYLERMYTVGTDNYFVNIFQGSGPGETPLVYGDIIHFTKGHLQALCKTGNHDAAQVQVQQMPAPEQSEYVHSQMFWMVKDDHAFVIQSLSLRTETFEQYLSWLLKTKTSSINSGDIVLASKFDQEVVGGDLNDIQEIIIGGTATPAPEEIVPEPQSEEPVTHEVTRTGQLATNKTTGWAQAREILKTLLGGDANVSRLMSTVPADAELNVQVHIGFKTRKRQVSRAGLKQLETGLRHLPDSQLQVVAKGAKRASDGTVRLHHNASVLLLRVNDGENKIMGSLLDPQDVLRAMFEAFTNLKSNGKIS